MQITDIAPATFYIDPTGAFGPGSVRVSRITDKGIVIFRFNAGCGAPGQLSVKHFAETFVPIRNR